MPLYCVTKSSNSVERIKNAATCLQVAANTMEIMSWIIGISTVTILSIFHKSTVDFLHRTFFNTLAHFFWWRYSNIVAITA